MNRRTIGELQGDGSTPSPKARLALEERISLDALAADPGQVQDVSVLTAAELLAQLAGLQSLLLTRLLATDGHAAAPPSQDVRLLTIPEVAERLSVPPAYAYELARRGDLPAVRLGKKYVRVSSSAFEEWLALQQLDSRPTAAYSARHRRS